MVKYINKKDICAEFLETHFKTSRGYVRMEFRKFVCLWLCGPHRICMLKRYLKHTIFKNYIKELFEVLNINEPNEEYDSADDSDVTVDFFLGE